MRTSIITLIHKKGKYLQYCANYRPISLGNVDGKILAKVLAKRLENLLPTIIHPDQVGFIRARSSADNMRRLLHLMWNSRGVADPVMAFSLDRVEWGFLFQTLRRFGFGSVFTKWVKLLYTGPQASVLCNGLVSSRFKLHRGTKQGCPLSPLIFVLVLEPLAIAIRSNPNIKGVLAGQQEHKIFLYADDILLIFSNPQITVPTKINMAPNVAPMWVHIEKELLAPFPAEAFLTQLARPVP